ncbi:MAG: histidinol-phosphatase HisJ family protein [Lachnospiraceae bacterium]|nr:histidinol-phosphatase HisJ family protein [Lachnospiraceae bacterium]MDD7024574.1 histidinol-phosphatase HisJ family protein [Oscillospiraceae bacterium]
MIYTDCHLHSSFSGDSDTPMEDMIRRGIRLGLRTICFTDHMDPEFPESDVDFGLDTQAYASRLMELKDKYKEQIEILFGVEFGLQSQLTGFFSRYEKAWPFDFIIGSSHLLNGTDPYYPENLAQTSDQEIYRSYFESILYNLKHFDGFQVYGHLDYIVRYGRFRTKYYRCSDYMELFDEIFRTAIEKGIGIEINTSGLKYGLGFAHPHPELLKRYRELGGELLTIGSDAHQPEHIAYDFQTLPPLLKACGFSYYTLFRDRKPVFLPIE